MIDFEQGIIATLNPESPLVSQKLCLFWLSKYIHTPVLSKTWALNGCIWIFEGEVNIALQKFT